MKMIPLGCTMKMIPSGCTMKMIPSGCTMKMIPAFASFFSPILSSAKKSYHIQLERIVRKKGLLFSTERLLAIELSLLSNHGDEEFCY